MIKKILVTSALVSSSFLFPIEANSANPSYSEIYVFGDSLSDTGNVFNFTGGNIPPSPFYSDGRFSNGLNWVDYLSQDLGNNPIPTFFDVTQGASINNGVNFAFGGALTGTFITGDDMTTPVENSLPPSYPELQSLPFPLLGLQSEVGLFAQNFASTANPDALYIIWAGANDYLPTDADVNLFRPLTETTTSVNNVSSAVNTLVGLGAKNLLVANLPDLGITPRSLNTSDPSFYSDLSESHNQGLETTINNLQLTLGNDVNLTLLDTYSLINNVVTNPSDFGFTNVTQGCLLVGCNNPNEYLFWDDIHPTTALHNFIADFALETLNNSQPEATPEPNNLVGLLSFGMLAITFGYKSATKN